MRSDLTRQRLVRWASAVVAAVWLLGGNAEHVWHVAGLIDPGHPSITSASGPLAVNADHTNCDRGSPRSCPEAGTAVDVPRAASDFLVVGVFAAAVAVGFWFASSQLRRGPPRGAALVLTGQDILKQFCLARR